MSDPSAEALQIVQVIEREIGHVFPKAALHYAANLIDFLAHDRLRVTGEPSADLDAININSLLERLRAVEAERDAASAKLEAAEKVIDEIEALVRKWQPMLDRWDGIPYAPNDVRTILLGNINRLRAAYDAATGTADSTCAQNDKH